jgi:protein-S-isoprenylcysteine O-methyltransferase Ste14
VIYFLVVDENRYAASTIEVVEGQTVVSTRPYAIVRHPMYSRAILVFRNAVRAWLMVRASVHAVVHRLVCLATVG